MKLEFENVTKNFNGRNGDRPMVVLDGISFGVRESEFFCIVGPSGCGKSTIINLAAGFFRPDQGRVAVNGKEISSPSASRTVVFQEYALFPWKTVFGNIEFGLKCSGIPEEERRQIVYDLAKKVDLEKFLNHYPAELSGGMKQRVAIARSLAVKPEIILMDEPFASLDQQTRDVMQEELLGFMKEFSQTIIFVTHNIEEAIFLGDRVLVLGKRPAHAKALVEVPFSKPRLPQLRNEPVFLALRRDIGGLLRKEAS
ncbi:MAG: ABC transporter ATP-binding protein [Candidatus Pacebacteria bacterium]|jgi:NitT/TauT family transport system ATP-binding protein|nr:ABC transporter ATP-binding protein [Candidatus Paceibacterota bacterium]